MGLLDHLWDDTVAGPPPDSGLGKLRNFSASASSAPAVAGGAGGGLKVTRSITVIRPAALSPSSSAASSPRSPSLSPSPASDPASPFTPRTPRGDWKSLRRKAPAPAAVEMDAAEPRYPTVYDWVVIGSLDR